MTNMTATTKQRIPLAHAESVATDLIRSLAGTCEQIEIAGSIRRRSEAVSDIELILVPRFTTTRTDLFGNVVGTINELDDMCSFLKTHGILADRLDKNGRPAWGKRYKRAIYQDVPVDLFSATPENVGLILAIRTGPAGFTRSFVTQSNKGGRLPNDMYVSDGALWVRDWGDAPRIVPTPTEEDFFAAIGMPWLEPEQRS